MMTGALRPHDLQALSVFLCIKVAPAEKQDIGFVCIADNKDGYAVHSMDHFDSTDT